MNQPIETQIPTISNTTISPPLPAVIAPKQTQMRPPLLTIFLTFLITAALFIGGYFGYQQFKVKPSIPAPSPTASWNTYKNLRQNYEINYPSRWQVTENTYTRLPDNEKQDIVSITDNDGGSQGIEIDSNNSTKLTTDEISRLDKSPIKIDGHDAYVRTNYDEGNGEFVDYFIIKENHLYRITFIKYPSDTETINEHQILSTFRFIDSPSSSTTDRQMGFIKSITDNNGEKSLVIDYAEMLNGDAAKKAMLADGECNQLDACDLPNDFYIRNNNPQLRTFTLANDVAIFMQTYSQAENGFQYNQPLSLEEFAAIFSANSKASPKDSPYWIDLKDNQVIKITEQYLP